jgi:hypothetical protein
MTSELHELSHGGVTVTSAKFKDPRQGGIINHCTSRKGNDDTKVTFSFNIFDLSCQFR